MKLAVNDEAPAFVLQDETGKSHSLHDYRGKWIVLYFYPQDDTSGCTKEACHFRDSLEEIEKYAVILGVSGDSVESHKQFKEKYGLNFTLLADPERNVIDLYSADGLIFAKRVTFLIDPNGVIRKIYDKVDPEIHADEILTDLVRFS